jgi:hypothetical protein
MRTLFANVGHMEIAKAPWEYRLGVEGEEVPE